MKRIILAVLMVGALAALGWLYSAEITNFILGLTGGGEKKETINAIARLNETDKNVTYKRSKEVSWAIGQRELGLEVLDSVSTGADSLAVIGFNVGPIFNLEENSLVVIEQPSEPLPDLAEVDFHQGTFNARNDERPDATLRVKSNNVVAESKGRFDFSMTLEKKTKKAQIWVKVGQVKLTDDKGNQMIVNENESKEFSTDTLEPPPPPPPPPLPEPEPEPEPEVVEAPPPPPPLSSEDIAVVLTRYKKYLDACYPEDEKLGPRSDVSARLVIEDTGRVSKAVILRSAIKQNRIKACLKGTLMTMKFPKFSGGPITEDIVLVFR